jgi:hypothetical protein
VARRRKYYLKKQLFDLEVKGHYGTRHTALWSCTHIPNIIDLSRKTKKLWSRQASLRRSGRRRMAALRGDISFRYLKQFFLVISSFYWKILGNEKKK